MTEDFIQSGRGPNHEEARAKITPMRDSIRNIKTAYEILAHPRCKWSERDTIEGDLALDSSLHEKDRVTLTDKEAMILGALTRITKIPFDPKKRAYLYSEVVHSPEKLGYTVDTFFYKTYFSNNPTGDAAPGVYHTTLSNTPAS